MAAVTGAIGAFLLTFGFFFMLLAPGFVYNLVGYQNSQNLSVYLQLVGMGLASVGAGMLAYGVLSRSQPTNPAQQA